MILFNELGRCNRKIRMRVVICSFSEEVLNFLDFQVIWQGS